MSIEPELHAWVEVDLDALRENYRTVRRVVGSHAGIIPMVKGNGYGLGVEHVIHALEPMDPFAYGVATVPEGVELRELGIERPVFNLSPTSPGDEESAARAELVVSISDLEALDRWIAACRALGRRADFHVEVDTGMGRCGFDRRETKQWAEAILSRCGPDVRWQGIFTHFYGADDPDWSGTRTQWERFNDVLAQLPISREDLLVHVTNSAGALRGPEYAADAVRPGIYLYGGDPAPGLEPREFPSPRQVVAVRARLLTVREVPAESTVGYGATYVAEGPQRWGTIGVGYADGIRRALSNRGQAIVRGRRVPIIGRVSMNVIVVDLTSLPDVRAGDVVTLIGNDGDETITVDEVAEHVGTIGYEILTGLTPRLPRLEIADDPNG